MLKNKSLIESLQNSEIFDHPVRYFKIIETHISWVLLTGDYVYKIKKPVDFGFLDFSTLEKRKHFCKMELSYNQSSAPEIYLELVKITGSFENPTINGKGEILDYAVKMREFSQEHLFNYLLDKNQLTADQIEQLAVTLATFHQKADRNGPDYFGTPEQIHEPLIQNFDQIEPLLTKQNDLDNLKKLRTWTEDLHHKIAPLIKERKEQGFVRACHGDIHLGNITLIDNHPVIFDCIEFNESFRWTDTMGDLGFLIMDLHENNRYDFAYRLINRYLLESGDYGALHVLPYYQAYRAMVRAKIALFDLLQVKNNSKKSDALKKRYHRYIDLAMEYTKPNKNFLAITYGFSGSGKTTVAKRIVEQCGAIQIRSDIERKKLAGMALTENSHSGLYSDLYSKEITDKIYDHLCVLAGDIIQAGYSVIVDATFLEKEHRDLFLKLADKTNIPMVILHCKTSIEQCVQWLSKRTEKKKAFSEADKTVLIAQQSHMYPLTPNELKHTLTLETDTPWNKGQFQNLLDKVLIKE